MTARAKRFPTLTVAHYEAQLAGVRSAMLSELHAKERENARLRRQVEDAGCRLRQIGAARTYLRTRLELDDDAKRADQAMVRGLAGAGVVALVLVAIVGFANWLWWMP